MSAIMLFQIASAQRLSVHKGPEYRDSLNVISESLPQQSIHLDKAGKHLDTAALCDVISWGFAAASVCAFVSPKDGTESGKYENIGIVCAAAALAAKVFSVSYTTKAGNELRLAAGSLSITF